MLKTLRTLTVAALAAAVLVFPPNPAKAQGSDPMLGQLILVGFTFCPRGWTEASGQLLPISSNQALFSLYGTTYGGDGRTTFALPDLRGRAPISLGQGPGLSNYVLGQKLGVETVTLNATQMPSHTHTVTSTAEQHGSDGAVNSTSPTDSALAVQTAPHYAARGALDLTMEADSVTVTSTAANTGGGQSHENRPPRLVMRWCVALQGIFPSRN